MKLIDAHVHLSDAGYAGQVDDLIEDADKAGVAALMTNSVDLVTCQIDLKLAEKYPGLVYPALGVHPSSVNALKEGELEQVVELIRKQQGVVKAVGEIGLDIKYETVWQKQLAVFDRMLRLGEELDLPVIIHSRGTTEKVVELLPSYRLKRVLLHWFSQPMSALQTAMDRGYFITEGPPAVYSSGIREVVEKASLSNFLTETDGPVKYWKRPFEGQLTKPSFIRNVVEAVAEIKKMKAEDVAEQVAQNFEVFSKVKLK